VFVHNENAFVVSRSKNLIQSKHTGYIMTNGSEAVGSITC